MDAINSLRSIVSNAGNAYVSGLVESWILKHVVKLQNECVMDREGEMAGMLKYQQEKSMVALLSAVAKDAVISEESVWLHGEQRQGKITTNTIYVIK